MGKIVQLDDLLSNKIAAGEVVERPASVVKELVENSIDANSTRIEIELVEGGLSSIRVIDNGDGIEADDVRLAFSRHATSKIKNEHDLFQIRTMGFRGEALPSIASVSHVEMKTCTGDGPGCAVKIINGEIDSISQAKARKGTDITVSNLFYNTPARLKHMKTVNTELGNITDVVNRLALANPDISFRLKHNDKEMLSTSGNGQLLHVIAAVYGMGIAKNMIPFQAQSLDYEIRGFIGKPELNRASRNYISLFMNGRYIKNYVVQKAVLNAYHTFLPIGRFPVVILSITMDPTIIDINVHPSKLEARLSKEPELCQLVQDAIRNTIRKQTLIPEPLKPKKKTAFSEQPSFHFEHNLGPAKEQEFRPTENKEARAETKSKVAYPPSPPKWEEKVIETPAEEMREEEIIVNNEWPDENELENKQPKIPPMYPIGQMHGTYICAQNEHGLYLIDQHAAQERMKYEFFKEKVGKVASELQTLMVPYTFQFTNKECMIINDHIEMLQEVGVFLEPFGQNTFIVREHPQWFPKGFEKETMEEIIQQVIDDKRADIKKLREKAAIMMSCKGSIKANRHLRNDEIFQLLEDLRNTSDPFTCPHGRPIIIHFSTYELEKMFKRVQ